MGLNQGEATSFEEMAKEQEAAEATENTTEEVVEKSTEETKTEEE